MEKRKFEKLGVETSLLGFGCMRFPQKNGVIDEVESEKLLDLAMESGVNYFDTAYPYHGGASEPFVGKVLNKYKRENYYLATKLPVWEVQSVDDAKRLFESQLQRLDKDYVDFYLLHALSKGRFDKMVQLGIVEFCEGLKKEGKIKYLGFSFHDSYEAFEEILTYRAWDFCQIQFNYMDTLEQAGEKGYALTEKLNIPLIIMEPLKGGALSSFSPDITERFKAMDASVSPSSFGMRWVASHPNVKVILSGMSSKAQVEDNLHTFNHYHPLSKAEQKEIEEIVHILESRIQSGCTGCRYCMPCPAGVNIPANFRVWNNYHIYQSYDQVIWRWETEFENNHEKATQCIKCGKCEPLCPQKLHIREDLAKLSEELNHPIWK